MDRLTHRQVELEQWEEEMGGNVGVDISTAETGDLNGEEVDQDVNEGAGSDVDGDSDQRQGFSVQELTDAFIQQC